jgi:hypothetical protein
VALYLTNVGEGRSEQGRTYRLSLPAALLAIALGCVINRRFDAIRFFVYVHAGLVASGAGLLLQAIVIWIGHQPAAR